VRGPDAMTEIDQARRSADDGPVDGGARSPRLVPPSEAVSGHIEGLDGVRAFAVVTVLVFHLWPNHLPGGFLGVDVFFVISGFLITTLLLREGRRDGRIDLPAFWLRRVRRLVPALVLVVATSLAAALVVSRSLLVNADRQTLGALTFSSNWLEVSAGSDYFGATAPALFVTFWSLAVEEQFYLFWPIILVGVLALAQGPVARVRTALAAAAASALLMAVLVDPTGNTTRVYYGTDTHLFGLMIGAAVAFAFAGDVGIFAQRRWLRLRRWVGFAALAGLLGLAVVMDDDATFTYRGGLLLASVLGAVVVASLPGPPSALTRTASQRPIAWIGERSYGIYLWHWPVILIVAALLPATAPGADPTLVAVVLSLGATFGLAAASYRWIEMPVRRDGFRVAWSKLRSHRLAAGAAAALVGLAVIALVTAPNKSQAELAVEEGERLIAEQNRQAGILSPDEQEVTDTTAATTTVPALDAAWPPEQPLPPGDLMIGFGDSVLSGVAPAMYAEFPGMVLDAVPIRQWKDAPGIVQQSIDAGTIRPVVVLSFGTNAGLESEGSQQGLRAVLDALGPARRVVLVNTVGISDWVPSTNATLAAISAEYPNTLVMDWHSTVAANPGLLHDDRTHPNMEGMAVFADQVATTIDQLGPQ
jgi:peptidoglycan/LPS O-acetylase OafA/YrhL/lysophospholipase L1-like esterase